MINVLRVLTTSRCRTFRVMAAYTVHAYMHTCIHTYLYTYTYVYICICILIANILIITNKDSSGHKDDMTDKDNSNK